MRNYFILYFLLLSSPTLAAEKAVFAGGCFWCMQPPFDKTAGVLSTQVGYTGGAKENPTYKEVSSGSTGHFEAIEITFDPTKVSYKELLKIFWANIDPYDDKGQFCDKGAQYSSAVFYAAETQKMDFEASLAEIKKLNTNKVATIALPLKKFFPAEDYHQSYYKKNPIRYKYYRYGCGRDKRLEEIKKLH